MSSPISEIRPFISTGQTLSPRQRLEQALDHLAPDKLLSLTNPPGKEELLAPIQRINGVMRPYGVEFQFSHDAARLVARIIDIESGELIRQIPSEEVLRISSKLDEIQGLLVEERV